MSDFLSNFNGDNYDRRKQNKEPRRKEAPKEVKQKPKQEENLEKRKASPEPPTKRRTRAKNDDVEIDPDYKKQKKRKRCFIVMGVLAACLAIGVFYYQQTHVKVPNFIGKNLTDMQVWASENKVKTKVKQSYDLAKDANTILAQQQKAGTRIKKGRCVERHQ